MNAIIDSVTASRRLKKFTAFYAVLYIALNLALEFSDKSIIGFGMGEGLLAYIPYKVVAYLLQAPFVYGLVRGLVTKNYKFTDGLKAYTDVKSYAAYALYVIISLSYDMLGLPLVQLADAQGNLSSVGAVVYIAYVLLKFIVQLFLIKMFFDAIDAGGRVDLARTVKGCINLLTHKTMKFLGAELFMLLTGLVSSIILSTLLGFLPNHWAVVSVLNCANAVQFGFVILSWPVYYLYYRWAFEE